MVDEEEKNLFSLVRSFLLEQLRLIETTRKIGKEGQREGSKWKQKGGLTLSSGSRGRSLENDRVKSSHGRVRSDGQGFNVRDVGRLWDQFRKGRRVQEVGCRSNLH